MPISNISAFASSVNIADIDNDGDLDIFSGVVLEICKLQI